METCKDCKYWINQNADKPYPIKAEFNDLRVGACRKIQKGLVVIPNDNGIFITREGVTHIKFSSSDYPIYTLENFGCNKFKTKHRFVSEIFATHMKKAANKIPKQ